MSTPTPSARFKWPFAPESSHLNKNTGMLKLIAMVCMFCDHAGKMLFPHIPLLRIVGRIAFPIFCYCAAMGVIYTRDPFRYLRRMLTLALVTQPIYAVALDHTVPAMYNVSFAEHPIKAILNFYVQSWTGHPSVLLTLSLGIILLWSLRNRQIAITCAVVTFILLFQKKLDYGLNGFILILLFYVFIQKPAISLPCVLAFLIWWGCKGSSYSLFGFRFGLQMYALLSLPFIYTPMNFRFRLPKVIAYSFYPLHMIVIYFLNVFGDKLFR